MANSQDLPGDLYEVATSDVAYDLIKGAGNARRNFDDRLEDLCEEHLTDAQLRQLREMGHDIGEFGYNLHPDGSLDAEPCPHCGEENVFNVIVREGRQMVASSNNQDERQEGRMHADDYFGGNVISVRCGGCNELLVDEQ